MRKHSIFISLVFCFTVLITCKELEKEMLVSTDEITNILANSADAPGNVVDMGGGITQHGHCWGKNADITTSSSKTQLGSPSGTGAYTSQITNLEAGTLYYVKAYVSDGIVTVYGKVKSFTTTAASVPVLETTVLSSLTATSAASGGNIMNEGGAPVTVRGICWGLTTGPVVTGNKTTDGPGSGIFTSNITGLSPGTEYFVRAYATNSAGTGYGNEIRFTTVYYLPTLATSAASAVTSNSAACGGNISSDGGATVTARGVCWNTSNNPTVSNSKTDDGPGTGIFVSSITNLSPGTTYYIRAYATNNSGTAYGNEVTINTSALVPSLSTTAVSTITSTSASSGGNITSNGGAAVTARGVCFGTSSGPDITGTKTTDNTGTGIFVSTLSNLTPGTTYYVRAYATNITGTAYGNEVSFTTSADIPALTTTNASAVASTTATSGGNITSEGGASVTARGVCWSTTQNPTLADQFTSNSTGPGSFVSNLTGLTSNTTYYLKAYATNIVGTAYGNQISFTTTITLPSLTTDNVSAITATSATCGGSVTSQGGAPVTQKGVCWGVTNNPTIDNSITNDGSGTGAYISSLTGLIHGTTYYVRAYATNSGGTSYGNEVSFTALIELPTLSTLAISNLGSTSASSGGNISNDGGAAITNKGVCWSISPNPTTSNDKTTNGTGIGSFLSNLTGLSQNTAYYVRAYATNSAGIAYGNQLTFTTDPATVTDIDLNVYNVVRIGTQLWIDENLIVTKYNNGDLVPNIIDGTVWRTTTSGGYCWFDNNLTNKTVYGALYNWYAASDSRNLCPTGWHVPSNGEWIILTDFLGGVNVAGGKLKETGIVHWTTPNTGATNETGFNGLPGGVRYAVDGLFNETGIHGSWWSSTQYVTGRAWSMGLDYSTTAASLVSGGYMGNGWSVRCLKD